jgi:hypothetical protein
MAALLARLGLATQQAPLALSSFGSRPAAPRPAQPQPPAQLRAHSERGGHARRECRRARGPRALAAAAAAGQQQPHVCPRYDVIGLGQAMVDVAATVDDSFLDRLGVHKGERRRAAWPLKLALLGALSA